MYRVILSTNDSEYDQIIRKLQKDIRIDRNTDMHITNVDVYFSTSVIASINPILREDNSIDSNAFKEYEDFIIDLLLKIESEKHYKTLHYHISDRGTKTSHYLIAYKESESTKDNIKELYIFRVSDHRLPSKGKAQMNRYFNKQAQEQYKAPKDKIYQSYKLQFLYVDREKYDTYEDAMKDLLGKVN